MGARQERGAGWATAGAADEVTMQLFVLGDIEIGGKFGSCWNEVLLVIIKVKLVIHHI